MTQDAIVRFRTPVPSRASLTRPSNTTQYAAGDVISDTTSDAHYTFGTSSDNVKSSYPVRRETQSGVINAARLWSSANQSSKLDAELWLFHTDIAVVADNSAFAPTDAEMLTLIGIIPFSYLDWKVGTATAGAGGNAVCEVKNIDLPIFAGKGLIYGQLVARNTYTPVSGEIFTADLVITQD